ncbi:transposase [Megamonas hypermegale]|uniref:transposase n=1 Tax=Megamonas hypermegale TaxID=158847 RepID=UPI00320AFFCF
MTKYSNEFKVKAIKMVLKGDSISHVAKILNMPNTASLCRWIFHYENGGHNFFIKIVNILLSLSKKLLNINGYIIYH